MTNLRNNLEKIDEFELKFTLLRNEAGMEVDE